MSDKTGTILTVPMVDGADYEVDTSKFLVSYGVAWTVGIRPTGSDPNLVEFDLFIAPWVRDYSHGSPEFADWENILIAADVENWEGTDWADTDPSPEQIIDRGRTIAQACGYEV